MYSPQKAHYIWQHPDWPHWRYDAETLVAPLANARRLQGIILGKAQAIGFASENLTQVINEIWVQEVIATAAIEGEKLNLDMVRSSVMRQSGLADTGPSSRNVDGLVELMRDATQNFSTPLDADRLCRWQSALFPGGTSGIRRIEVGKFRTIADPMQIVSGTIGREVVHYQAPDSAMVPVETKRFLKWFDKPGKMDGIIRAGVAHLWFETIHPFEDGNGRVGRAIIDLAIAQDVKNDVRLYSMSRQLQQSRKAYYDALNHAQKGSLDITPWLEWFLIQFAQACQKSELMIDNAIEKSRFWNVHAAKDLNERQRKTLQKLLDAGDGGFLGGLTAQKHSKITGASKASATRDLADLVQRGALISRGAGRGTKYYVNVPGWLHEE
jgi:Fic family protein